MRGLAPLAPFGGSARLAYVDTEQGSHLVLGGRAELEGRLPIRFRGHDEAGRRLSRFPSQLGTVSFGLGSHVLDLSSQLRHFGVGSAPQLLHIARLGLQTVGHARRLLTSRLPSLGGECPLYLFRRCQHRISGPQGKFRRSLLSLATPDPGCLELLARVVPPQSDEEVLALDLVA